MLKSVLSLSLLLGLSILPTKPKDPPQIKSYVEATLSLRSSELMSREKMFQEMLSRKVIFGSDGLMAEELLLENDGSLYRKTIFKWDSLKQLSASYTYNNLGEVVSNKATVKNEQGQLIQEVTLDENQKPKYISTYEYDSLGREVSYKYQVLSINKGFETRYEYNSADQKIKQIRFKADGSQESVRTYKYDSLGQEYFQDYLREKGDYTRFMSFYDEQGRLVDQKWYNGDSTQTHRTSFEYIDDEYGNWITKRRFSDDTLNFVWERELSYL